jgi:hypothetical protein
MHGGGGKGASIGSLRIGKGEGQLVILARVEVQLVAQEDAVSTGNGKSPRRKVLDYGATGNTLQPALDTPCGCFLRGITARSLRLPTS